MIQLNHIHSKNTTTILRAPQYKKQTFQASPGKTFQHSLFEHYQVRRVPGKEIDLHVFTRPSEQTFHWLVSPPILHHPPPSDVIAADVAVLGVRCGEKHKGELLQRAVHLAVVGAVTHGCFQIVRCRLVVEKPGNKLEIDYKFSFVWN